MGKTKVGKRVLNSVYFHREALACVDPATADLVQRALALAPEGDARANLFKVDARKNAVSLLHYRDFFDSPFPVLSESWRIYLDDQRVVYRSWENSANPPILHRKELMLSPDHPRSEEYRALTRQAEEIGLFTDTHTIGFEQNWVDKIQQAGYRLDNHQLVRIDGNTPPAHENPHGTPIEPAHTRIERHRTAIARTALSTPLQTLARNGLIRENWAYFDYGCGHSSDIDALQKHGFSASGWDPHFAHDNPLHPADVVNLGFVINVIESPEERIDALQKAFSLAQRLLVVSVMLYSNTTTTGKPWRDGFLTQRNTFQKYYTQTELKEFLEAVLDNDAIPVAPGVMYVFSDKAAEQSFLLGRQSNPHTLQLLGYRREPRGPAKRITYSERIGQLIADNSALADSFWQYSLEHGRLIEADEFPQSAQLIDLFGSWNKAVKAISSHSDPEPLNAAATARINDLLVYLALQQFARRKTYKALIPALQRDIRAHFGDYKTALAQSTQLLFQAGHAEQIETFCAEAARQGLGHHIPDKSLQIDSGRVALLPPLLRVYAGCATALYGDIAEADLIKLHTQSGKVTLMKFDQFEKSPLPRMIQRIKVKLRDQDVDIFDYGTEYPPPLLYFKSRHIGSEFPNFAKQKKFDSELAKLNLFDPDRYGPPETEFEQLLIMARREIKGFTLTLSHHIPAPDERCGAFYCYRDLVALLDPPLASQDPAALSDSALFDALYQLITRVIDPIRDYFGGIELQAIHYSPGAKTTHRKKTGGQGAICLKAGESVPHINGIGCTLFIPDENMVEVAEWVGQNIDGATACYRGCVQPVIIF